MANQPKAAENSNFSGQSQEKSTTIDPKEVKKFTAIAEEWWDPFGKFKPLHKFNPVRLAFIRDSVCTHFGRDRLKKRPLEGLRLLDVGCGGGLVAEPMHRLGANVTAIDASERNIKTALAHAAPTELKIDYRATTVEALIENERATNPEPGFDIVLNLEVVEHVADVNLFLQTSASLVRPGGIMIMATINRTAKALALAKIGAEYILRWLPMGTHDPRKFVKPEEANHALTSSGMSVTTQTGVSYNPLLDLWRISQDRSVNYMLTAIRAEK